MEENEQPSQEPQQKNSMVADAANSLKEKGGEEAKKQIKKKLQKEAGKKVATSAAGSAASASLMASLSYVLFWVALVILIIFIVIGLIMFFVTMPGMVMEKLKALFKELGNYVAAFFGADTTAQIEDTEICQTLDYLEQMGWDIKAEGFLTGYIDEESDLTSDEKKQLGEDIKIDERMGVVRSSEDDSIKFARSDFIFSYIMSDNYVYTLKNDNLATKEQCKNWFDEFVASCATAAYKIRNFFFSPLYDALGITDAVGETWGKGLIGVYYDKGVGRIEKLVNDGTLWNWDAIEIDSKSKKLSVKRRSFLNNNNALEFSLDGWTGRYGMPVEFLLAMHKATMMPDLAMDMISSFPTEIALLLHETSGEAITGYKIGESTYIAWPEISEAITGLEGRNWLSKFLANFVEWIKSDNAKVEAARSIGVDVGNGKNGCTCSHKKGDGDSEGYAIYEKGNGLAANTWHYQNEISYTNEKGEKVVIHEKDAKCSCPKDQHIKIDVVDKACEKCKGIVNGIWKYLGGENDYHFQAYTPYIAQVTDHWYRDVYFVVNKNSGDKNYTGNLNFVDYDYNYEALVNERWTLYETYTNNPDDGYKYNPDKAGEFIIFEVDSNGKYKKSGGNYVLFDGTFSDARPSLLFVKDGNEYVEYTGSRENRTETVYKFTSDGKYVEYTGDIAVAKKAVTQNSSDKDFLKDVGWKDNNNNVWSAYKIDDTSSGFEPLFNDEDIAKESNQYYKDVMKNSYINLNMQGNLVQEGEGQRTETNTEIKKMFLNNNYFRYSGDETTAEIITKLRDKVKPSKDKYGPLTKTEMGKEYHMDVDEDGKNDDLNGDGKIDDNDKYKVKDYAGKVMLNQDSLNAFSMLENTHTLDADYIYRDFKELIVELGYFTKEEITSSTIRRVLQFPVPAIGSGGYPDRTIDKLENEFGTTIHSEGDIEANEKNKLISSYMKAAEELKSGVVDENIESGVSGIDTNAVSAVSGVPNLTSEVGAMNGRSQAEVESIVNGMGSDFERISKSGDGYDYIVKCGSVEFTHYYQFKGSYAEKTFTWSGQTKTLHQAACGPTSCVNILTGYGLDVNPTDNIVGISFDATTPGCGKFMESYGVTGKVVDGSDAEMVAAIKEALSEGRPVITLMSADKTGDQFWTTGGHFVPMIGMDSSGNIITLDSGSSKAERHTYTGGVDGLVTTLRSVWIADEAPDGMAKNGEPYTGYKGNEAVVSPVTGILLEYGTYSDETDKRTDGEKYRVNTDLLYGKDKIKTMDDILKEIEEAKKAENDDTNGNGNKEEPKEPDGPEVIDRVGYAKILVLDAEHYKKLEGNTSNKWQEDSLVSISTSQVMEKNKKGEIVQDTKSIINYRGEKGKDEKKGFLAEDYENWSQLDKTVYGYKEFAELYNAVGIAGYVLYIDGFVTEKPDTSINGEDANEADKIAEKLPAGTKITMQDFAVDASKLKDPADEDPEEKKETAEPESLYEVSEVYKMASSKAFETAKSEMDLRDLASPSVSVNTKEDGELIFIKEGTILGRTMTDKEVVTKIRVDSPEEYEAYRPSAGAGGSSSEENQDRVLGNYVRTIFRDTDNTVVENVEDYMKLDEMTSTQECAFEHLAYFLGCLEEGFYEKMDQGDSYGVEVLKDGAGNTTAFGLTKGINEIVASKLPEFGAHLAAGSVPKKEAQDAFIITLEAAKETIQSKLTTPLGDEDTSLYALIDLSHASPSECYDVVDYYNSKGNNLSNDEKITVFSDNWGSNENYGPLLRRRGRNRGLLAAEGKWYLYQKGSAGDEVIFDTDTPWTEFCEGGGTYDLTRESSGFYHVEKKAYTGYVD